MRNGGRSELACGAEESAAERARKRRRVVAGGLSLQVSTNPTR